MSENHSYGWKINFLRAHYFPQLLKVKKIMFPQKKDFLPLSMIFRHLKLLLIFRPAHSLISSLLNSKYLVY